jgi:hypothetical protein
MNWPKRPKHKQNGLKRKYEKKKPNNQPRKPQRKLTRNYWMS